MIKSVNYKKTNKIIYAKDAEITVFNSFVFINKQLVDGKVRHIFLSGEVKISCKAIEILNYMRIPITFSYKSKISGSILPFSGSAKTKFMQVEFLNQKNLKARSED